MEGDIIAAESRNSRDIKPRKKLLLFTSKVSLFFFRKAKLPWTVYYCVLRKIRAFILLKKIVFENYDDSTNVFGLLIENGVTVVQIRPGRNYSGEKK